MRHRQLRTVYLVVAKQQYVYVYRPRGIYPLPLLIILRRLGPSHLPFDVLAYLQDHKTLRFRIISFRKVEFIHHRCIYELLTRLKAPRLRLYKRGNSLIWSPKLHIEAAYRILYVLSSVAHIRAERQIKLYLFSVLRTGSHSYLALCSSIVKSELDKSLL